MSTLRELAEAAKGKPPDGTPPFWFKETNFEGYHPAYAAYIAAMSPDVTLALLAAIPEDPYAWNDGRCYRCNEVWTPDERHAPDCEWVKAREVSA